jgi:hypothetical protein
VGLLYLACLVDSSHGKNCTKRGKILSGKELNGLQNLFFNNYNVNYAAYKCDFLLYLLRFRLLNYFVLFLCPCALSVIGLTAVISYTLVLKHGIELNWVIF